VAKALLKSLSPRDAQAAEAPPAASAPAIPSDAIVGEWTATGQGGAKYSMSLAKDGRFTWGFTRGKKKQEAKGVQTLEGNVLAMEPDSGGILLAELSQSGPDTLQFKMIGGASDSPPLEFRRNAQKTGS
jgi:hypothetical protein